MEESATAAPPRRTFVVQVHAEGVTTLEDVQSRERVVVEQLRSLPGLIERRLANGTHNKERTP